MIRLHTDRPSLSVPAFCAKKRNLRQSEINSPKQKDNPRLACPQKLSLTVNFGTFTLALQRDHSKAAYLPN
jgi:hypothetical protein